jgi:prepilin-type N-terminal cleavage/methylation domain-containing protein
MRDIRQPGVWDRGRRHNAASGLTLLEVMIALVILSIGLLALSGMQIASIRANGSGFKSTTAISLADQRMQQLKNLAFSDASLTAGAHAETSVTVSVGTSNGINGVVYGRSYVVCDINNPCPAITSTGLIAGVKLIAYTVTWNDGNAHSVSLMTRMGNELL